MTASFKSQFKVAIFSALALAFTPFVSTHAEPQKHQAKTIIGDVYDASCYFTQEINKPISHECAMECASAGSPLVIVAPDGTIYWPIDPEIPSRSQNYRLGKFGGMRVKVVGEVYERSHENGIAIKTIELAK